MNYLQRSSREKKRISIPLIAIAVIVVLISLVYIFSPATISRTVQYISVPVWKAGNAFSGSIIGSGGIFASKQDLLEENRALKESVEESRNRLMRFEMIQRENRELKELWGRSKEYEPLLASVLAKPPRSSHDTLIVDVGDLHDVETGDLVMVRGDIVIGEIVEVSSRTSKVVLFSRSGQETEVTIDRTDVPVEARGSGGGNFIMEVSREIDILEDDLLVLAGVYPLVMGRVAAIEANPADAFQRVYFNTPVNITELRWVEIIPQQL